MNLFNLNNVKGEATNLLPGIRTVFLKEVKTKEVNNQSVLEFSFTGRGNDNGFYSAAFFSSTFDEDHQYNENLSEEDRKIIYPELNRIWERLKNK